MKKSSLKLTFAVSFTFLGLLISGCAKSSGSSRGSGAQTNVNQTGYFQTQYGCLPQGQCVSGQVQYGNQCLNATNFNGAALTPCDPNNGNLGGYREGQYYQDYYQGYYGGYYPNYGAPYNPYQNGYYQGGFSYCYWYFGQMVCR